VAAGNDTLDGKEPLLPSNVGPPDVALWTGSGAAPNEAGAGAPTDEPRIPVSVPILLVVPLPPVELLPEFELGAEPLPAPGELPVMDVAGAIAPPPPPLHAAVRRAAAIVAN
jgi:hypothetical protein